jgi:hypothetical protein
LQTQPTSYNCLLTYSENANWSKQTRLNFDEYTTLIDFLTAYDKQGFIKANGLDGHSIDQWISVLSSSAVVTLIEDTTHIGRTLDDLRAMNNKLVGHSQLPKAFNASLIDQRLYKQTFHNCA